MRREDSPSTEAFGVDRRRHDDGTITRLSLDGRHPRSSAWGGNKGASLESISRFTKRTRERGKINSPRSKLGSPIFLAFKSVLNLSSFGLPSPPFVASPAAAAIGPLIALSLILLPKPITPPPLPFSGLPLPLPLLLFLASIGDDTAPASTNFASFFNS